MQENELSTTLISMPETPAMTMQPIPPITLGEMIANLRCLQGLIDHAEGELNGIRFDRDTALMFDHAVDEEAFAKSEREAKLQLAKLKEDLDKLQRDPDAALRRPGAKAKSTPAQLSGLASPRL